MIQIENLRKSYGDFSLNISLEIPKGRVSGIVGRNGAGKTTAIKSILGLIRPDGGTVRTLGRTAAELTEGDRAQIGVALSESGFSSYMSLNDIIAVLKAMYPEFDEKKFRQQCAGYGLPADKRIRQFSTGMNARLKTLVACSHGAKLLVLDEPTAGLDVVARREVLDLLRGYLAEDPERSMLISSHISSDLEGICDDIYMIHNGRIVLHEDTDTILSEYAVMRLSPASYAAIDRRHILKVKQESYGFSCLTDRRRFYAENYPEAVMDSGSIDDMIIMMSEGE